MLHRRRRGHRRGRRRKLVFAENAAWCQVACVLAAVTAFDIGHGTLLSKADKKRPMQIGSLPTRCVNKLLDWL